MKPSKTPWGVLSALEARLEQRQEERHRRRLAEMFPPRPACERHGWSPQGPGLIDNAALAALCPACRQERKAKERREAAPEAVTLSLYSGGLRAEQLYAEHLRAREQAGFVTPGSSLEREMLRALDEGRRDEVAALKETASDHVRKNQFAETGTSHCL